MTRMFLLVAAILGGCQRSEHSEPESVSQAISAGTPGEGTAPVAAGPGDDWSCKPVSPEDTLHRNVRTADGMLRQIDTICVKTDKTSFEYWVGPPNLKYEGEACVADGDEAQANDSSPICKPYEPSKPPLTPEYPGDWTEAERRRFYGPSYTGNFVWCGIGSVYFWCFDQLPNFGYTTHLTSEELDRIADACRGAGDAQQQLMCAAWNCAQAEKPHHGECRHISSCLVRVARRLGFDAHDESFSFDRVTGHVVVRVKIDGKWFIMDPTWDPEKFWYIPESDPATDPANEGDG